MNLPLPTDLPSALYRLKEKNEAESLKEATPEEIAATIEEAERACREAAQKEEDSGGS